MWSSPDIGIEITKSREFTRVEINLLRLVEGELPDHEIFFDPDAPRNRTLLDNVLVARGVDENQLPGRGLKKPAVENQLSRWAELLRTEAPDLLEGSTEAFDEAKALVASRVEEKPQEIVVWLPETASSEEEAAALARAAEQAPSNVAVRARRYRA